MHKILINLHSIISTYLIYTNVRHRDFKGTHSGCSMATPLGLYDGNVLELFVGDATGLYNGDILGLFVSNFDGDLLRLTY